MKNRITPEKITTLTDDEVFVFGSNENGWHGAGAALTTHKKFKAPKGKGFGCHKHLTIKPSLLQTFAIPTKDWYLDKLELKYIQMYIDRFIDYASTNSQVKFLVTEIGCGLAGYKPEDIAPLFKEAVYINCIHLPQRFWDVLNKTK